MELNLRAEFRQHGVEVQPGDELDWRLGPDGAGGKWAVALRRDGQVLVTCSGWLPQPISRIVI